MIKRITMIGLALVAFCCMAWSADKSWTGVVSDSHCGVKHAQAGDAATACVKKCVDGGAKYALVSKGKVYQLEPQDKFADHAGHQVKVTGTMTGDTITASDVAMAAAGKPKGKKKGM